MNGVTVATFNSVEHAEPLREQLERAGIHAEINDESVMSRLWFVAKPLANIRVKVANEDYEKAKNLLGVWDTQSGVLREAVRCPECGSSRVEYPQHTRKFILPNLLGGVLTGLGMVEKEFYCDDCQFTWPKTGSKPSRTRPNLAPYYFIDGVVQPEKKQDAGDEHDHSHQADHEQHHGE
jgi:Putative prokaryotic signal transducing protein